MALRLHHNGDDDDDGTPVYVQLTQLAIEAPAGKSKKANVACL